jgi:hypothetical protein
MTELVRTAALVTLYPLRYYAYLTESAGRAPERQRSLPSAAVEPRAA